MGKKLFTRLFALKPCTCLWNACGISWNQPTWFPGSFGTSFGQPIHNHEYAVADNLLDQDSSSDEANRK